MATINPHTTRSTGTVLTAAIYNADHQNHITNANNLNNELATVVDVGTSTGIIVSNGAGVISGRSLTAGANIVITNANGTAGNPSIAFGNITTVDNTIARFDGTAGAIQPSTVVISDVGDLDLVSTDAGSAVGPVLTLFRNSASAAADDHTGSLVYKGKDSAGNDTLYAATEAQIIDPTNGSEDARLIFSVMKGGTLAASVIMNPGVITLSAANAPTANLVQINSDNDANLFILTGGNSGSQGGQIFIFGDAHATAANDIAFFSNNVDKLRYDASLGEWAIPASTPFHLGGFSVTGATAGTKITTGLLTSSGTGTGLTTHQAYYNANGNVGGIATSGSNTTFATSSDKSRKTNLRDFDSGEIIDALEVWYFDWINGGSGYGVIAQDARKVFPDPIVELPDGSLGADYSKYVPLLLREVQSLRQRVGRLDS